MSNQQNAPEWRWNAEETFEVSGKIFQEMLALKNEVLNNPETNKIILAIALDEQLNKVFEKGIQDGKIRDNSIKEEEVQKIPTDQNHYSSSLRIGDTFKEVTGMGVLEDTEGAQEVEHTITNQGEKVWFGDYWIPQAELDIWKDLKEKGVNSATMGYINGRSHFLGNVANQGMSSASMNPGYVMWISYK
jgi:hypothetical protein